MASWSLNFSLEVSLFVPRPETHSSLWLFSQVAGHAALRSERLLSARHEFTERHVQPSPAGGAASTARAWLQALGARAHSRGETGW